MAIRSVMWNGQSFLISIPPEVARTAGLKAKDRCFVEVHNHNQIVVTKCPASSADLASMQKSGGGKNG